MKDLIRKILKESEEDEFAWVPEGDLPLGKHFEESDVCFEKDTAKDDCRITITDSEIVVKINLEDWVKNYVDAGDEGYYFLRSLLFGYEYDSSGYDLDDDEFNYILYHLNNENKNQINEIMGILGIDGDVEDYRDEMFKLFEKFEDFKPIYRLVDSILYELGTAVTNSRQNAIEWEFNELRRTIPFGLSISNTRYSRDGNDYIYITLPVDYAFDQMADGSDLTQVLYKISTIFNVNWDDIYYGTFQTSDATDEINVLMDNYLSDLMEELETNESVVDYKNFNKDLKEFGFQNTSSGIWKKIVTPKNSENVYTLQIRSISAEDKNFVLNFIAHDSKGNFINTTEHRLPFNKLGEFIYNYKLDI